MTIYDAAMVGVIVAGMVWGAFRGITWQLASILSLVLGYSVAQPLSTQVAPYFPGEPVVARALAMIAVYFAASGGVFLAAWIIRATLRQLKFEAFDRHLGMVLGGIEGALLGLVVTLFVVSLAPHTREPIFASPSGRVVAALMSAIGPVLPAEARNVLKPFFEGVPAGSHHESETSASIVAHEPELEPAPRPAPRPAPAPPAAKPATPRAGASQPTRTAASPTRDDDMSPASFRDFLDESQRRIGRAVIEGATEGIRRAAQGEGADASERPRTPARR